MTYGTYDPSSRRSVKWARYPIGGCNPVYLGSGRATARNRPAGAQALERRRITSTAAIDAVLTPFSAPAPLFKMTLGVTRPTILHKAAARGRKRGPLMDMGQFYDNPVVRRRMTEYTGDGCFIMPTERSGAAHFHPAPAERLGTFLENGADLSRSLWDRCALIAHLDLEYVNFDFPAEPYLDARRTFALQMPLVTAVEESLADLGIAPLHLLTGRGHHFVWRVRRDSRAFGQLQMLGRLPEHLRQHYAQPLTPGGESISPALGRAFAGLALVMEYLGHRILSAAREHSPLPVKLAEVDVGPQERGRELLVLDLSEYGDPLNTRIIRIPFSRYLKPWYKGQVAAGIEIPPMVVVPLHEMDLERALYVRRSARQALALAKRTVTRIPEASAGMSVLIERYRTSELAAFHDFFYATQHDPPGAWPRTYDQFQPDRLPPEVRTTLEAPMDRLLKPDRIRQLVGRLLAQDWHPRHIAGLMRSKYERNHGWGPEWYVYDAATRADYYTRLFSGSAALGLDPAEDDPVR